MDKIYPVYYDSFVPNAVTDHACEISYYVHSLLVEDINEYVIT